MGLYIKQNGAIKPLAGSTPGEGLPVGAITAFTANTIPSGWLLCDGSTFDETLYPALFIALGGNVLPDLRETVLVGAGENTTLTIADHDVYELGEFKDDQFQGHWHTLGNRDNGIVSTALGANETGGSIQGANPGGVNRYTITGALDATSDGTNGEPRTGTTTHGKQVGVNYIIKATSGITTEAALDAFNMIKEYERKQNILSDIEVIPSVVANTDYVAEYDGYLTVNLKRSSNGGSVRHILVNGIPFIQGATVANVQLVGEVSTIPLKKGDVWSIDYTTETFIYGRWFKERDYGGR